MTIRALQIPASIWSKQHRARIRYNSGVAFCTYAVVVKLVDAQDLGSCPERGVGSTPTVRTKT